MRDEPISDASTLSAPMCPEEGPYGNQGGKAYTARAKLSCGSPSEKAECGGGGFPSQPKEDGTHSLGTAGGQAAACKWAPG